MILPRLQSNPQIREQHSHSPKKNVILAHLRPIVSILAVFILLGSVLSVPLTFQYKQARIHRSVKTRLKEGVPKEELHCIIFEKESDIVWTKPGREFQFDNHLYDVVFDESTTEKIQFQSIRDDEETSLFADLGVEIQKSLSSEQPSLIVVAGQWFGLHFLPSELSELPILSSLLEKENSLFGCTQHWKTLSLSVECPPPNFI